MGRNSDTARRQKGEKKMPEIKLKPCPFCGSEALYEVYEDMYKNTYKVKCSHCFAETRYENTKEEAANKWNRRINYV